MAAFITGTTWIPGMHSTRPAASPNRRLTALPCTRRTRRPTMTDAQPEPPSNVDAQPEPQSDVDAQLEPQPEIDAPPPEPYPGFFGDMKRLGLSEAEAYAQATKAQNQKNPVKSDKVGGVKNLLKPDGTPYAPWMVGVSPEYDSSIIKKRTDATGRLAADPQSGELSGMGLQWKMLGDELELTWGTGAEEGNKGFVVYRRAGKSDKWDKVSDYRDAIAELSSKGPEGGRYSFLVQDPQPGTWVYRISDVNEDDNVSDLAQVLVEIESEEDTRVQKIALAALLGVLALTAAVGVLLDPLSNTY